MVEHLKFLCDVQPETTLRKEWGVNIKSNYIIGLCLFSSQQKVERLSDGCTVKIISYYRI